VPSPKQSLSLSGQQQQQQQPPPPPPKQPHALPDQQVTLAGEVLISFDSIELCEFY
jgi:hypothetical protein